MQHIKITENGLKIDKIQVKHKNNIKNIISLPHKIKKDKIYFNKSK